MRATFINNAQETFQSANEGSIASWGDSPAAMMTSNGGDLNDSQRPQLEVDSGEIKSGDISSKLLSWSEERLQD